MTTITALLAVLFYLVASGLFLVAVLMDRKQLMTPASVTLAVGMVVNVTSLGAIVATRGSISVLTIQVSLSVLALLVGVGYLVLRRLYRLQTMGSIAAPLMLLLQLVSAVAEPGMSVAPEYRGPLLSLHITMAILGTAAFVLAAVTSVLYLIQDRNLRQKKFGPLFNRLPSIDILDSSNLKLVSVGFVVFTLAIALGGFFAWGNASSLQVQYLFAMASWLIYAAIIHTRVTLGWRGRRAAFMTLAGLLGLGAVLSSYLARSAMV